MKSIEVKSKCGRVWNVPLDKVRIDIANFYKDADGISTKESKQRAAELDDSDLETWFSEQYIWREVVRDGVLTKDLSDEQLIKLGRMMADQIRGNDYVWETAKSYKIKKN
jgi:hypothetical protein